MPSPSIFDRLVNSFLPRLLLKPSPPNPLRILRAITPPLGFTLVLLLSIPSQSALPSCLDGYSVFAGEESADNPLELGVRDSIASGNIGSNGSADLGVDCRSQGNLIARGDILLRNRATVFGNAHSGGVITLKNGAQVTGTVTHGASVALCALPQESFLAGTQDIAASETVSLPPGAYRNVSIKGSGILKLGAGMYRFQSLTLSSRARVEWNPGAGNIEVFVKTLMKVGSSAQFQFSGASAPHRVKIHTEQNTVLSMGPEAIFQGTLVAPRAEIHVLPKSRITGAVFGKRIKMNPDVKVFYSPFVSAQHIVRITDPGPGFLTNQTSIAVSWTVDGVLQGTDLTETLSVEGSNTITRCFETTCDSITVIRDTAPPVVVITSPADGFAAQPGPIAVAWTVDGVEQTTQTTEDFPSEGNYSIIRETTDLAGNIGRDSIQISVLLPAPVVDILSPEDGSYAASTPIQVTWSIDGVLQDTATTENLVEGVNKIIRSHTALNGARGADSIFITLATHAPVLALISPPQGSLILEDTVTIRWSANGIEQTPVLHDMDSSQANILKLIKTDPLGNSDTLTVTLYAGTRIPNVVGLPHAQAESLLVQEALLPQGAWVDNDAVPTGEVFVQSPRAGDSTRYRFPVRYSISRGLDAVDLLPQAVSADSMTVDPLTLDAGGKVSLEVANQGRGTVSDSFDIVVFEDRNRDGRYNPGEDLVLGQAMHRAAVVPGTPVSLEIAVSGILTFNGNRISVALDPGGRIAEVDEGNNVSHTMAECRKHPTVMDYTPKLKWGLFDTTGTAKGRIFSTPVVGQLSDDNDDGKVDGEDIPDIVVFTTYGDADGPRLMALDGRDGRMLWSVDRELMWPTTPAIGDIDGDGHPEVVVIETQTISWYRRILILDHEGNEKSAGEWRFFGSIFFGIMETVTLNDLDGDGKAEILWGTNVHDYRGQLVFPQKFDFKYRKMVTIDLDRDGYQELVGDMVPPGEIVGSLSIASFKEKRVLRRASSSDLRNISDPMIGRISDAEGPSIFFYESGYPDSIGKVSFINLDLDAVGEIPSATLFNPGFPTNVEDYFTDHYFYGSDSARLHFAVGTNFAVNALNQGTLQPYFSRTNLRDSSVTYRMLSGIGNQMGRGTVFDLDDDGNPEVLIQSDDSLYILDSAGNILSQAPFSGHRWVNGVTVADVDKDNHADIIVTGPYPADPFMPTLGVYSNPTWVGARPIFPNREYTVTNINDDGSIPRFPAPHWEANNTVNMQCAEGHYACVDISASYPQLTLDGSGNPEITARIGNGGALELASGIPVTFYTLGTSGQTVLATVYTPTRLKPGAYFTARASIPASLQGPVTFHIVADDSGNGQGNLDESSEANNDVSLTVVVNNRTPSVTAPANQYAEPGEAFTLDIDATDPDGDALIYRLTRFQPGMTIDSLTGVIHWIPTQNPPRCTVSVTVSDPHQGSSFASFLIYVGNGNNLPPVISSVPGTTTRINTITSSTLAIYQYLVQAADPEAEGLLEFELDCLSCQGKSLGLPQVVGSLVSWIPFQPPWTLADSAQLELRVRDARGGVTTQSWTVRLLRDHNQPPVFASSPNTEAVEDQPWQSPVTVFDLDDDVVTLILDTIPLGMTYADDFLHWTPSNPSVSRLVRIGATDGFDTTWQRFEIAIAPRNDAPRIVSTPVPAAIAGANYSYRIVATDEDGDALSYFLSIAPSGISVSSEGVVSWLPSQTQTDPVFLEVVARDPSEAEARQSWVIAMVPDTIQPAVQVRFSQNPVRPGTAVTVTLEASDNVAVNSTSLTRDGIAVALTGGQYTFTPTVLGSHVFAGRAVDVSNNESSTFGTLRVSHAAELTPPEVSISYSPLNPQAGQTLTFTVSASDTDGVDSSRLWVEVDGATLPVENGLAQYTALRPGALTAKAVAYDTLGSSAMASVTFTVAPLVGDAISPEAKIDSPLEDSAVYGQVELLGTALDANLAYYTLSHRDINTGVWTEYFRSTAGVDGAKLGIIDGTTLPNGTYEIRLEVFDRSGNYTTRSVQVNVAGEKKVGQFTLAFQDLNIPMSGLELAITRTYDSRIKTQGDFGIGWQMGMRSITLHENRNQGTAWEIKRTPGLIPQYYIEEAKAHIVTVTLPGGRKQEFTPVPRFFSPYAPFYGVMEYQAKPGTYSRLEAIEVDTFLVAGGEFFDERGDMSEPFNPQLYRLTLLDSSYFIFDQSTGGVVESGDANGNKVEWQGNAIRHNAGATINFTRDADGRIADISDGAGRGMQYRYDVLGNLSEVLDANGNSTRFKYGPNSYLMEVIDPRGVRAARTEYDEDGRVVRQINAEGDTLRMAHDLDNNQEEIVDFNGNSTLYTYDDQGNVLGKTDDAGNSWSYSYDSVGNLLSTTLPGGATKSSTFDDNGNELTSTDELGHTSSRTYDGAGRLLTSRDALGRETRYEYDSQGNLAKEFGPDATVQSERTYDNRGNTLTEKDPLGHTTTHAYNAQGWLTSTTDALGRTTSYSYDAAGRVIQEIGPAQDTSRHAYDANGNRLYSVNAAGDTTRSEYNGISKVVKETDALGHETRHLYNSLGDKVATVAADSTSTTQTFDSQGNLASTTDADGLTVEMEYDHENRVIRTRFATGEFTTNTYDALGRRTQSVDANGHATIFGYDAAGRNTTVTDAIGNITTYEYDAAGRKSALVDALAQRTEYTYDDFDRLVLTTFADGTTRSTGYDAAGRKTRETDPEGKVTRFEYDAVGNLLAVVDALNQRTEYSYNSQNNRLTQVDANGHTTLMAYDVLGRMVQRTYPNGDQERWGYDAVGNPSYHVKGSDSTAYAYDVRNREVKRTYFPSLHEVTTAYSPAGKREEVSDYRGMTRFTYDGRGRLFREEMPNGDFIESRYDAQGNRTQLTTPFGETRYTYDALNRMDSVVSPQNQATTYRYNAVGNRDSVINANGTSIAYAYDVQNRLTEVRNWVSGSGLLSHYTYSLNDAGIRTAVEELDGSRVDYGYDDLYRLVSETRTGSHAYAHAFTYDAVGNRLSQVKNGLNISYSYNVRDQLLSETSSSSSSTYGYDAAGRMTTQSDASGTTLYAWEDGDRMASVSGPGISVAYQYDGDGRRVKETSGGSEKQYLIDRLLPYGQVVLETDVAGNLRAEYTYGLERVSQNRSGTLRWYLPDGQGSVRTLTDEAGLVADTYDYTAFGEALASTGSTENEFKFTGEQLDGKSGLYYNRARWLNPRVGRFMSVDPFKGAVARPLSLNKYLYAEASPAWKTDPTGLFGLSEALTAISLIGIQTSLARPSMPSLRYTIYFRSFAPWDSFGEGMGMGPFGGDSRTFSTSLTVTSRINSNITVDVRGNRILNQRAWSDESTSGSSSGFGMPILTVTRMGANGLKAKMEGSNPLVPFDVAADIDATMNIFWKPQAAGNVCFDGNVVGDAFPNAEIFVKGSGKTTMLHTFETAGERNGGPFDLLPGDNTRSMGAFSKCD